MNKHHYGQSPGLERRKKDEEYARQNVFNARRAARDTGMPLTGNSAEERQYAAAQNALERQRRVAADQPAIPGPGALRPSELRARATQASAAYQRSGQQVSDAEWNAIRAEATRPVKSKKRARRS